MKDVLYFLCCGLFILLFVCFFFQVSRLQGFSSYFFGKGVYKDVGLVPASLRRKRFKVLSVWLEGIPSIFCETNVRALIITYHYQYYFSGSSL